MAKFCAHCGVPLGPADNFCAGCGKQVIRTCPTCGQNWDGVKRESTDASQKSPAAASSIQQVPEKKLSISTPATQELSTRQLTTARIQPVYGKDFNSSSDCPNCGSKGNKKSCPVCDYGR